MPRITLSIIFLHLILTYHAPVINLVIIPYPLMHVPFGHKQPAVLCVLKHADQFLLLKRKKEPNAGMYTPVGGKIDPFESPRDAALRETFEETGLKVGDAKYCGVLVDSSPTKYNWICFVYLAEIDPVPPPPCNEGTLEWIPAPELLGVPTPPTDYYIYEYVLAERPFMLSADYDEALRMTALREEIEGITLVEAPAQP